MYIGFIVLSVATLISAFRAAIYQLKLYRHLQVNHTEKWKELTTVRRQGSRRANYREGLKFIFGQDYLGDPEVLRMMTTIRNSLLCTISGPGAILVWGYMAHLGSAH
jgi:ABC-type dipeptide/oligopeptide/nickel transport system permease subunit